METTETVTMPLRHYLSQEETAVAAQQLAREVNCLVELQNEKKAAMSAFKGKLDSHEAEARRISIAVANGYEMRPTECAWKMNDPERGQKSLYRTDTQKLVHSAPMNEEELQGNLFDPAPPADTDSVDAALKGILQASDPAMHAEEDKWVPTVGQRVRLIATGLVGELKEYDPDDESNACLVRFHSGAGWYKTADLEPVNDASGNAQ